MTKEQLLELMREQQDTGMLFDESHSGWRYCVRLNGKQYIAGGRAISSDEYPKITVYGEFDFNNELFGDKVYEQFEPLRAAVEDLLGQINADEETEERPAEKPDGVF